MTGASVLHWHSLKSRRALLAALLAQFELIVPVSDLVRRGKGVGVEARREGEEGKVGKDGREEGEKG